MKNIIFLGSKPIGYECLNHLIKNQNEYQINILGVITNNNLRFGTSYNLKVLAEDYKIPIIHSLEDMMRIDNIDIIISIQYHEILKKIHIAKAKEIAINLHMAPLPEYRGCNQFSFAIYNEEREFGTTIHRLEEGIDNGGIIFESRFDIYKDITVKELYEKTYQESLSLFKRTIKRIIDGNFIVKEQSSFYDTRKQNFYLRKDINQLKEVDINSTEEEIDRIIRATSMPGFEPPYMKVKGKRVFLVSEENYTLGND